jgi:hypothetical protein
VGHALRSSGLLHVEASRDRISHSGLKTGGGATVTPRVLKTLIKVTNK